MIEIAWNHEIVRSPIFLLVIPRYPDKRTRERIEGAFFSQKKRDQTRGGGGGRMTHLQVTRINVH